MKAEALAKAKANIAGSAQVSMLLAKMKAAAPPPKPGGKNFVYGAKPGTAAAGGAFNPALTGEGGPGKTPALSKSKFAKIAGSMVKVPAKSTGGWAAFAAQMKAAKAEAAIGQTGSASQKAA